MLAKSPAQARIYTRAHVLELREDRKRQPPLHSPSVFKRALGK